MPPSLRAVAALRSSQLLLRPTASAKSTLSSSTKLPFAILSRHGLAAAISTRNASTQSTHGAAEHTQQGAEAHTEHAEHSHYEPPNGWLWGIPPGEEYKKEGWENIWYYGFYGSIVLTAVAYAWKPDTRYVEAYSACGIITARSLSMVPMRT